MPLRAPVRSSRASAPPSAPAVPPAPVRERDALACVRAAAIAREASDAPAVDVLDPRALRTIRVGESDVAYDHRFIASTERVASDGGIILASAWQLERYRQRPRWITNHDLWAWESPLTEATLGRSVYQAVETGLDTSLVGPSGRALVVYVRYAPTPFAQEVKALYEVGGLDDVSVRWDWQTSQERRPYEDEAAVHGDRLLWVCERADLLELSAVLMGADPGAQLVRSAGGAAPGRAAVRPAVQEAFERARAGGCKLTALEAVLRAFTPVQVRGADLAPADPDAAPADGARTDGDAPAVDAAPPAEPHTEHGTAHGTARGVDVTALQDAMAMLDQGVDAVRAMVDSLAGAVQQVTDAQTVIRNHIAAALDGDVEAADDAEADDDERAADVPAAPAPADPATASDDAPRAVTMGDVRAFFAEQRDEMARMIADALQHAGAVPAAVPAAFPTPDTPPTRAADDADGSDPSAPPVAAASPATPPASAPADEAAPAPGGPDATPEAPASDAAPTRFRIALDDLLAERVPHRSSGSAATR